MEKGYIQLFKEIAHTLELLSESALEQEKKENKSTEAAEKMRTDFSEIYDKICSDNFSSKDLTRNDLIHLLIGCYIIVKNTEDHIEQEKKAVEQYKTFIIPKLERITNETKTDSEAYTLSLELFNDLNIQ